MAETNYILGLQKLTNKLINNFSHRDFFAGLMTIYGLTKTYINEAWDNLPISNCAYTKDQMSFTELDPKLERPDIGIQKRVLFRFVKHEEDVREQLEDALKSPCFKDSRLKIPVVIAVSPTYIWLYNAIDNDYSSFDLDKLPEYHSSLQPLSAQYKKCIKISTSTEADEHACKKLTLLMDKIEQNNDNSQINAHDFNNFMRRLVFCLFAEDTGLFAKNLFTESLENLTGKHGEGSEMFFTNLFLVLDTPEDQRDDLKVNQKLLQFPYVGADLFKGKCFIPQLDLKTRDHLIKCGLIAWNKISPSIFGSLFQYSMDPNERRQFGAHYTSEANILKLLKPLFLDELTEKVEAFESEFQAFHATEQHHASKAPAGTKSTRSMTVKFNNLKQRLEIFHDSLAKLKIMDPACGCGNFLVVAYRELRKLEIRILKLISKNSELMQGFVLEAKISIDQFYGIEIEDWPTEVAQLSMWLMQHQLNQTAQAELGNAPLSLPLTTSAHIVCANALTTDWNEVLPATECTYLVGNPPFGGQSTTSPEQKKWLKSVYPEKYPSGGVDFVSGWFVKAANYMLINPKCRTAFVSTNSICQGAQVDTLWGLLINRDLDLDQALALAQEQAQEQDQALALAKAQAKAKAYGIFINFAYNTFAWKNEAANKAAVFCIIVGFSYQNIQPAKIFKEQENGSFEAQECNLISPYLMDEPSRTIIQRARSQISACHSIHHGNQATDDGNLLLSVEKGNKLIQVNDPSTAFLKVFVGSEELCNNTWRYCLWLKDEDQDEWKSIPMISERLMRISEFRAKSSRSTTKANAVTPWKFEGNLNPPLAIVVPRVSSERRPYIPLGMFGNEVIVSDAAFLIPNPDMFDYAILSSKMHNLWMRFTIGRLKSDYRYSRELTYNTFVWPELNYQRKLELSVLGTRLFDFCSNSKLTLGELNNPESMPIELKLLHDQLDALVESYYRDQLFSDDEDRLAFLIGLYNKKVTELEQSNKGKGKKKDSALENTVPFDWNGTTSSRDVDTMDYPLGTPNTMDQSDNSTSVITAWLTPLNANHIMVLGSTSGDNGFLQPNKEELIKLLTDYPEAQRYVHRLIRSQSFYGEQPSYCLWIQDTDESAQTVSTGKKGKNSKAAANENKPLSWQQIPEIKSRVEKCKNFRMNFDKDSCVYHSRYHAFSFSKITYPPLSQCKLMLPRSIKADYGYIPTWLTKQPVVADNSVCIVPTEDIIDCALLNSRMHWVWMCATSRLKKQDNAYFYSIEHTYNNLVWPNMPDELRDELTAATNEFLLLTNGYADRHGQALSWDVAGTDLVQARDRLNTLVERCYRSEPFHSDAERLEFLKELYLQYKF